jgi:hypothetical protein
VNTDDQGQVLYRVNPNFYGGVDMLWAAAEAFRPLTPEDIAPIHPEAEDKNIFIDSTYQTLSCFEGDEEIISAGRWTGVNII